MADTTAAQSQPPQPTVNTTFRFRPLNEREKYQIRRQYLRTQVTAKNLTSMLVLMSAINDLRVDYQTMQGGFTICTICLWDTDAYVLWVGASRRSRHDRANPIRGEAIAFNRAIRYSDPAAIDIAAPADPLRKSHRDTATEIDRNRRIGATAK